MHWTSTLVTAATGHMGGAIASHDRLGQKWQTGNSRTNPRTPQQNLNRANLSTLADAWRGLTRHQRAAWEAAASQTTCRDGLGQVHAHTGYTLFLSLNKNLFPLTNLPLLTAPPPASALGALLTLTAQPVYTSTPPLGLLAGWSIQVTPTPPATAALVLLATPPISASRLSLSNSLFRRILCQAPPPALPVSVFTSWQAVFGSTPPNGSIALRAYLLDPASGHRTPSLQTITAWRHAGPQLLVNGAFTIPDVTSQTPHVVVRPTGAGVGWTFANTAEILDTAFYTTWPLTPSGTQALVLQGPATAQQTLTTVPGQNYQLAFYSAKATNQSSNTVTITANAATVATVTPNTSSSWLYNLFTFTATASSTTFQLMGANGSGYAGLALMTLTTAPL